MRPDHELKTRANWSGHHQIAPKTSSLGQCKCICCWYIWPYNIIDCRGPSSLLHLNFNHFLHISTKRTNNFDKQVRKPFWYSPDSGLLKVCLTTQFDTRPFTFLHPFICQRFLPIASQTSFLTFKTIVSLISYLAAELGFNRVFLRFYQGKWS